MKKLALAAVCGSVAAVVSYYLVELFAHWYGPRYIKSDDDIGTIYMVSLVFMALCTVGGAVAGFVLLGRRQKRG